MGVSIAYAVWTISFNFMKCLPHIALAAAIAVPSAAAAHPHVFVQAQVTVLYEADRPVGVQVDWVYDEFFSLLLTSDLGIDLDGDMVLTPDEEVVLAEAVTTWPQGFEGDLEVRQNGAVIPLGAKVGHTMSFADGIVRETHVRVLPPMEDMNFELQVFDPYYFIAYDLIQPIRFSGRDDCASEVIPADMDAARAMVADLLGGLAPEDVPADGEFPPVGSEFADTAVISCG